MLRQLENTLTFSRAGSPAKTFWRLGWIGFWTQIGFGSLPVILVVYAFIFDRHSGAGARAGNLLIEYLTLADLFILAFTTVWSYRYTRLARQLAEPERQPSQHGYADSDQEACLEPDLSDALGYDCHQVILMS